MARSIEESLNIIATKLSTAVSPSTGGFIPDARIFNSIIRANTTGWGKRKNRLIAAVRESQAAEETDKEYRNLVRAQNAMAANPTKFKSASDFFKWEQGQATIKKTKANADYNWWYDNLSEKDQFIHDNTIKYKSRGRAEQAWRSKVLKGLPSFFKDSKLSTKTLEKISKGITSVKGLPGGNAITKALFNPFSAGTMLGLGAIGVTKSLLAKADSANASYVGWANGWNVHGKPSERFTKAAMLAGVTDPKEINQLWGKLITEWGDANIGLSAIGQMSTAPGNVKALIAKDAGISNELFYIADLMSGRVSPDNIRKTSAKVNAAKLTETLMQTEDKDFGTRLVGYLAQTLGTSSVSGRWFSDLDFGEFENTVDKAYNAAASAERFDTNGSAGGGAGSRTKNESWNVHIEHLETPNVDGFVDEMKSLQGMNGSEAEAVIEDNDTREVR